jgi:hypothetical protein
MTTERKQTPTKDGDREPLLSENYKKRRDAEDFRDGLARDRKAQDKDRADKAKNAGRAAIASKITGGRREK